MHCFMRTLNNNNNTKQFSFFKHTKTQFIKTQIKTLQKQSLNKYAFNNFSESVLVSQENLYVH